jgi:hypothetical protein
MTETLEIVNSFARQANRVSSQRSAADMPLTERAAVSARKIVALTFPASHPTSYRSQAIPGKVGTGFPSEIAPE